MYKVQLQKYFREASFPVDKYAEDRFVLTKEIVSELRPLPYLDQWRVSISEKWFHVKMQDHSLFVFSTLDGRPSYSYLHCPLDVQTMAEFLTSIGESNSAVNFKKYAEDYEREIETAPLRARVTPIRYDYDPAAFRSGVHPLAHLHIGLDNQIRIALRREMTPVSFCFFVMRQMYPVHWEKLLEKHKEHKLEEKVRKRLSQVSPQYWHEKCEAEIYLS